MIIIDKNAGPKIGHTEDGTAITFGNNELTLDLAELQEEEPVHVTICYTKRHALTTGKGGITYVAEIDIPAMEYEHGEPSGEGDEAPVVPVPLDMEKVTLTLWAIEEG